MSAAETGSQVCGLAAHPEAVHGLAWLSSQLLLSGCDSGKLFLHDLRQAGTVASTLHIPAHSGHDVANKSATGSAGDKVGVCCIERICGVGAESIVAVGGTNGMLSIVDLRDNRFLYHHAQHAEDIRAIAATTIRSLPKAQAALSNTRLVTASYDSSGFVLGPTSSASSGAQQSQLQLTRLAQFAHASKILSVSPVVGGNSIVSSGADGRVLLWSSNIL
jgi:WD40 repeat protein